MVRRLRSLVVAILRRNRFEHAMSEEMRFHLDAHVDDLVRSGLSRDEAVRRARLEFGSVESAKEASRDARGLRLFDELRMDLRYAIRLLRQSRAFTVVAVLSLALGVGANTAIFSLVQGVLRTTLPVHAPEELRLLSWVSGPQLVMNSSWGARRPTPTGGWTDTSFSYAVFDDLRRHSSMFERLFAFKPVERMTVSVNGEAEVVPGHFVSGDFYQGVGVVPVAGRPIVPADDQTPGAGAVVVISDAFWARRFGRDSAVLGRTMHLNDVPMTIVGINPPGFTGMDPGSRPDVFVPLTMQPVVLPWRYGNGPSLLDNPDYWWVLAMGRLKPGADERQAQAALDAALRAAVRESLPDRKDRDQPRLRLLTGERGLDGVRVVFGKPLLVLVALVGLVLLIACANLASLLLARAAARQREISLRLALGAGRWRIGRQLLTEGLVLALLGGAAGLVLGYWARNLIPQLLSTPWNPSPVRADFDGHVLAVSLAVTVLTGVLFSVAPAWQSTRVQVGATLLDGTRTTSSRPKRLARRSLVVLQVGLSVLLLIGAGLFLRTLWNLRSTELGFRPDRVLLFDIDPPRTRYAGERRAALFARIEQEIGRLPGVQSATLSSWALIARITSGTRVTPAGRAQREGDADRAAVNEVGDRFFETMGIPILYGRAVGPQDRAGTLPVAVVNQQFVRTFFSGDTSPLGKTFERNGIVHHIVGISGDARYGSINEPVPPTFYPHFAQATNLGTMTFEVRTPVDHVTLANTIREVVRSIDGDLPVIAVRSQVEQIESTLTRERMFAALTSGFGLLALVLACVGIYGIMASSVTSRIGEIGIRMALGAERRRILVMILRETIGLTGVGVILGVLAAAGLARYVESLLYGLTPFDAASASGAVLLMLTVALLSAWWPARFAARLDPVQALRRD